MIPGARRNNYSHLQAPDLEHGHQDKVEMIGIYGYRFLGHAVSFYPLGNAFA